LLLALDDHGASRDAAEERRVDDGDRERGVVESRAEHGSDADRKDEGRKAEDDIHHPTDGEIEPPADVATDESEDRPDDEGDRDARERDAERDPRTVNGPAQHVAA